LTIIGRKLCARKRQRIIDLTALYTSTVGKSRRVRYISVKSTSATLSAHCLREQRPHELMFHEAGVP